MSEKEQGNAPDTHGAQGKGWYGFDLDGTLAVYDHWRGLNHIGEPIKPMCDLIKKMNGEGKTVKIVTARVAPRQLEDGTTGEQFIIGADGERKYATGFIKAWCQRNLGFMPEIVYTKDSLMLELYDDRVKQVVPNEGLLVEDMLASTVAAADRLVSANDRLALQVERKHSGVMIGFMLALLIQLLAFAAGEAYDRFFANKSSREQKIEALHKAIHDFQSEDWN